MALLRQLEALSARQREATLEGRIDALPAIHDARDQVMVSLVTIEHELKPLRTALAEHRHAVEHSPVFQEVIAFHRQAADLVGSIVIADKESLEALRGAEEARRSAAEAVERGETTLAAYRRVIAPAPAHAALVNRRG